MKHLLLFLSIILCMTVITAPAATRTYDGGATTNLWTEPVNWDGDSTIPAPGDDIIIDNLGSYTFINPNTNPVIGNITYNVNTWLGWYRTAYQGSLVLSNSYIEGYGNIGANVTLKGDINWYADPYNSSKSGRIYGKITEEGGPCKIIKTGEAFLRLDRDNDFSGGIILSNGEIRSQQFSTGGAFGSGPLYYRGGQITLRDGNLQVISNNFIFESENQFDYIGIRDGGTTGIFLGAWDGIVYQNLRPELDDNCTMIIAGDSDNTVEINRWQLKGGTLQIDKKGILNAISPVNLIFPVWSTDTNPKVLLNEGVIWDDRLIFAGTSNVTVGGINTNGTCTFNRQNSLSYGSDQSQVISITQAGGGTCVFAQNFTYGSNPGLEALLHKIGEGVVVFNGDNDYSGGTRIHEGTLLINNGSGTGTGTGPVFVGDESNTVYAAFGGSGTTDSDITFYDNTALIPGARVGVLTIYGDCDFSAKTTYEMEIGTVDNDTVIVGGTLTVSSNTTVKVSDAGGMPDTTYTGTLFAASAVSGNVDDWDVTTDSSLYIVSNATVFVDGSSVKITGIEAVPEPTIYMFIASCFLLFLRRK